MYIYFRPDEANTFIDIVILFRKFNSQFLRTINCGFFLQKVRKCVSLNNNLPSFFDVRTYLYVKLTRNELIFISTYICIGDDQRGWGN